jgi:hypothetical protein
MYLERFAAVAALAALLGCHGYEGRCPESLTSTEATSVTCPTGQSLARVCTPEKEGPCGLYCVAPAPEPPTASLH